MAERQFDVVINGGGQVGLVLAAALHGQGLRIAVVEAKEPPPWDPAEMDLRVSSITAASRRLLQRLGVWQALEARRVSPFEAIQAWDAGGGGVRFQAADLHEAWLGHIVENGLLQRVLFEQVRGCDDITLFCPGSLAAQEADTEAMGLRLDDGRRLRTRLLVAADGAASQVRERAEVAVRWREYGQQGIVAAIRFAQHHGYVARQRFLPGGPLALLPLADGRCSIVWSVPEDEAEDLLALSEAAFADALSEASEQVLGPVQAVGPRKAFPLRSLSAQRYIAQRVALVGDAAHVIHPLAGQGVNLGFLDAAALAEVLVAAHGRGRDIGAEPSLRRYERWRQSDNLAMQYAMDGFHWLFSNTNPWRYALRNAGLGLTDQIPFLKRRFMAQAMGNRGDLPALAR